MLVDREARVLTFDVVIGQTAAKLKQLTLPLGRGIAGLVAVSGQPLAVANAQQDPRHARDIAEQVGYLPNTILAVPVTDADGDVIGVLELLDRQEAPTYSLDDMELLGRFAELCALALAQRRAHALHTALIGRSLAALGGSPPRPNAVSPIASRCLPPAAAADPVARRAHVLAERVAAIAARGEAEQRACEGVLEVFAEYVAAHSGAGRRAGCLRSRIRLPPRAAVSGAGAIRPAWSEAFAPGEPGRAAAGPRARRSHAGLGLGRQFRHRRQGRGHRQRDRRRSPRGRGALPVTSRFARIRRHPNLRLRHHPARGRLRTRDRLRRDHPRARAGLRALQRQGARGRTDRAGRGLRRRVAVGDRQRDEGLQPQPGHDEEGLLRGPP